MKKTTRKVRTLVLRNYLGSAFVSFVIFALLFTLFAFDMEDQIFDNQVKIEADRLAALVEQGEESSGITHALPMNWYIGTSNMPDWMQRAIEPEWPVGLYEIFAEEQGHFHLAIRNLPDGEKLYLLFNARPYIRSTTHITALLISLAIIGGMIILVSTWSIHRLTRRLGHPMEEIAKNLESGGDVDFARDYPDISVVELQALLKALASRDDRIHSLIEREARFNRDMSHELRTPLTVAIGAIEVMDAADKQSAAFRRLQTSMYDMKALTEGILWLAREPDFSLHCDPGHLYQVILDTQEHLTTSRDVIIRLDANSPARLPVPEQVGLVMLGNLIRNALAYTKKGEIIVAIQANCVTVSDTGPGFGKVSDEEGGFGIGLSLVRRLCDHFGLTLDVHAREEGGTVAGIHWSD